MKHNTYLIPDHSQVCRCFVEGRETKQIHFVSSFFCNKQTISKARVTTTTKSHHLDPSTRYNALRHLPNGSHFASTNLSACGSTSQRFATAIVRPYFNALLWILAHVRLVPERQHLVDSTSNQSTPDRESSKQTTTA